MGIKSLNTFLRDTCPHVFEDTHISEYGYKKVAIDVSLYLFVLKARHSDPDNPAKERAGWLSDFVKFVETLRRHELHCVFVYDAVGISHPDKVDERQKRREERQKQEERIYKLLEALEHYRSTGEVKQLLFEFSEKIGVKKRPSLLGGPSRAAFDAGAVEYRVQKMRKNMFRITREDFDLTKKLFEILSVPYITAPLEAETTCSDLCKRGVVDAVLSRDSDVIAYGTPVFLTTLDMRSGACKRVRYEAVLEALNFTDKQFLDLCIMCGCDYNKNIFRVGPKTSYALLKKFGSIERIAEETKHDISVLKHVRCREIFRNYETVDMPIPHCGEPDWEALAVFFRRYNFFNGPNQDELLYSYTERLKSAFCGAKIVVEDESEEE